VAVDALNAQLEGRDGPTGQRRPQPVRKRTTNLLRTDQVELAGIGPLRRNKGSEIGVILIHAALISEPGDFVQ